MPWSYPFKEAFLERRQTTGSNSQKLGDSIFMPRLTWQVEFVRWHHVILAKASGFSLVVQIFLVEREVDLDLSGLCLVIEQKVPHLT